MKYVPRIEIITVNKLESYISNKKADDTHLLVMLIIICILFFIIRKITLCNLKLIRTSYFPE